MRERVVQMLMDGGRGRGAGGGTRRCSRISRRGTSLDALCAALEPRGSLRAANRARRSRLVHAMGDARWRAAHRTHRRRAAVDERRDRGRRDSDFDRAGDGVRHGRARDDAWRALAHAVARRRRVRSSRISAAAAACSRSPPRSSAPVAWWRSKWIRMRSATRTRTSNATVWRRE